MARKSLSRKSTSLWEKCEACQAVITQKDVATHLNSSCPPSFETWTHSYIMNCILCSTLEQLTSLESLKRLPAQEHEKLVLVSQSVLQLCGIAIGDPVLVSSNGYSAVKTAWPTSEKSVTSVLMIKEGLEIFRGQFGNLISVRKLDAPLLPALQVKLSSLTHLNIPNNLLSLLHHHYNGSIICVKNRLRILHYGRSLMFEVANIKPHNAHDINVENVSEDISKLQITETECCEEAVRIQKNANDKDIDEFYFVTSTTQWVLQQSDKSQADEQQNVGLDSVGGMQDIVKEIKELLDVALGNIKPFPGLRPTRGVLLHGPPGAGKSFVAKAAANSSGVPVTHLHSSELSSNLQTKLSTLSSTRGQHVIVIDDVDVNCRKRGPGSVSLSLLLDSLHTPVSNVIVLATTRHPDDLDPTLRRPGRLEREIELGVPSPAARLDILHCLLPEVPDSGLHDAAVAAHGFVPADLVALVSHAALSAAQRGTPHPTKDDFAAAFLHIRPSALREVLVQVPNNRCDGATLVDSMT